MAKVREVISCTPVVLPKDLQVQAAHYAVSLNPVNAPQGLVDPAFLAFYASKYWGAKGADLSVGFTEPIAADLRDRILSHANSWGAFANVKFRWTQQMAAADIRVTREQQGYWSYLGTDCRSIPRSQPTLCLQGFTMRTSEGEYKRVVRHEFGHALGCPHEQQRRAVLARLDVKKTIEYFGRTQGWDENQVRQQILTPLEENSILGSSFTDETSIMCYQFPASITLDGKPILGGMDFSKVDREHAAKIYPLPGGPVTPPPEPDVWYLKSYDKDGKELDTFVRKVVV